MRLGDLVKDEFGNIGVVIETAKFANGAAVLVQFHPDTGYNNTEAWVLERLLEVVGEHR